MPTAPLMMSTVITIIICNRFQWQTLLHLDQRSDRAVGLLLLMFFHHLLMQFLVVVMIWKFLFDLNRPWVGGKESAQ